MRRIPIHFHHLPRLAAACIAGAMALAAISPATAGTQSKERIYDDSFGNLIILSPSGYKRIVVGMGYVAAEMQAQDQNQPDVVYGDGHDGARDRHCTRPGVLWHGRSYMYGLEENELPTPPLVCD